ncbi:MAG: RluA family pseudouridine synthase [Candidatus Liptonbacteria bacterium]|nr:RluA family pseudouridine synthase [Candidatus Liptonbacteria bacterium]
MPDPQIVYEDKDFLAINKPAGLQVHEARVTKHGTRDIEHEKTLVDWLLEKYPEIKTVGDDPAIRPGIVHRLDKETSGIMLVARTQRYFEYLKSLFQGRQIKKKYLAMVYGAVEPKTSVIDKPIGIKTGTLKRSVHSTKMVKEAVTEYRVVKIFDIRHSNLEAQNFSLVEVKPKTGRTHQIRVHLASIGHPIVGDRLYGPRKQVHDSRFMVHRLMLHALSLEFTAEDGRRMKFEAEPPEEFVEVLGSRTS